MSQLYDVRVTEDRSLEVLVSRGTGGEDRWEPYAEHWLRHRLVEMPQGNTLEINWLEELEREGWARYPDPKKLQDHELELTRQHLVNLTYAVAGEADRRGIPITDDGITTMVQFPGPGYPDDFAPPADWIHRVEQGTVPSSWTDRQILVLMVLAGAGFALVAFIFTLGLVEFVGRL